MCWINDAFKKIFPLQFGARNQTRVLVPSAWPIVWRELNVQVIAYNLMHAFVGALAHRQKSLAAVCYRYTKDDFLHKGNIIAPIARSLSFVNGRFAKRLAHDIKKSN